MVIHGMAVEGQGNILKRIRSDYATQKAQIFSSSSYLTKNKTDDATTASMRRQN